MIVEGRSLIGQDAVAGGEAAVWGVNPSDGSRLEPAFPGVSVAQVGQACALAWDAYDAYREASLEQRAAFLEAIAAQIEALGDVLIDRAHAETGLPKARLTGERGRTTGQLRLFARVVRDGLWLDARIDPAMPQRAPVPRSDLRQRHIALGPVAVFGASNFPLAFSVAGGDTASALAAGCPVVVKGHSAHLGTSELVGRAIQAAVRECGFPAGVFSLIFGAGREVGTSLVADRRIKAVGFTGSRGGGVALMKVAAARPEPIPVYAEMSSINPVLVLPGALAARGEAIASGFLASLTLGAGQFCTNPGLVLAVEGPGLDAFLQAVGGSIPASPAATMLTPGIHESFVSGVERLRAKTAVDLVGQGVAGGLNQAQAHLFAIDAETLLSDHEIQDEVFGPSSVVVRCASVDQMREVIERLEGQLTITLQMDEGDTDAARSLLPALEHKAGRLLVNGFPTGVEVCDAMVHGGPFPATSDPRATSVGTLAIRRFLRPVCYQDFPEELLAPALRDGNPLGLWRLMDGKLGKD